jgi:serine/threonine protein kinase
MKLRPREKVEVSEAIQLFESLNLSDWIIDESFISKSKTGQATVLGLKNSNGQKGVFRFLKKQNDTAKKRFDHEIEILTDEKYKNKNIVNILEYSKDSDARWYISERGESFEECWNDKRDELSDNPIKLAESAINIIKQICEGLLILHKFGVVHRDIKPDNLVVSSSDTGNYPILIDFGISYSKFNEERITAIDEIVRNKGFSPDISKRRMDDDEILPWFDIFQLAQLLIWMLKSPSNRNWIGPLHWRWVTYDDRLPENTIKSLIALTAQCSEYRTVPQNAEELISLIKNLFPQQNYMEKQHPLIDIEFIQTSIAKGEAQYYIDESERASLIDSSYPVAAKFYNDLRIELNKICGYLQEFNINFGYEEVNLERLYDSFLTEPTPSWNLFTLRFPQFSSSFFAVTIHLFGHFPKITALPNLPESSNIFVFGLSRHSSISDAFNYFIKYTIERDGRIASRDVGLNFISNVEIAQITQKIYELINDSKLWELIGNAPENVSKKRNNIKF